ncbi:uncharacterized peptidase C1-like protein F26E4.3 [Bombyx mandarina]|uniref:Uncharacterized peptidase C1-like protein F26E4.3 n=1 Tax=Bombyx mandarina TaxID=7092 RepID=A0A6J2JIX0_BOMMA|nr:uncharacterized peptidase C1-like protein F26E4.3 [Bombyx mandarina]
MANMLLVVLVLPLLSSCLAYSGPELLNGRYCAARPDDNKCCYNRKDDCSVPILGTLCYCDEFCDHTRHHDDCCPDYKKVCSPPQITSVSCEYEQQTYAPDDQVNKGCNLCTCKVDNDNNAYWSCTQDTCMMSEDLVNDVNQQGTTWRATTYPEFNEKKLKDGLIYKLGTFPLNVTVISYSKDGQYPDEFDARREWYGYISPIADQGWCGSDWAVSIASIVGDRFSIQSFGTENVRMSSQTLLSCHLKGQRGCNGGNLDIAFDFVKTHGLVSEQCFPYEGAVTQCRIGNDCRRYRVGVPFSISKEEDIMYDIMTSGPALGIMTVYQDFFHYREGIYRHTRHGDQQMRGLHSVRIVGWGEDAEDKYWIVANSWGTSWGEKGYFRIARGHSGTGIESSVLTVLPYVS